MLQLSMGGGGSSHQCIGFCLVMTGAADNGTAILQKTVQAAYSIGNAEPRCKKTRFGGFRPGPSQTGLYSHRRI